MTAYETNTQHDPNNNNAMLGVHASASAIIQYGKIGRKQVRILAFTAIFDNANFHSNCFSRFVHFLVCWTVIVFFSGIGERGFRHSQSNSYHPHGTYCGLLSEDQTASEMLSTACWCHGQEWVHAGKICYFCITFVLFTSVKDLSHAGHNNSGSRIYLLYFCNTYTV